MTEEEKRIKTELLNAGWMSYSEKSLMSYTKGYLIKTIKQLERRLLFEIRKHKEQAQVHSLIVNPNDLPDIATPVLCRLDNDEFIVGVRYRGGWCMNLPESLWELKSKKVVAWQKIAGLEHEVK